MQIHAIPGFQDPFSSFSHLFAAPVFLVWGILLLKWHGRGLLRCACILILTLTTVFLLSMSGVYHLLEHGTARQILRQLDIAAVFALIAGTATPIHAVMFKGVYRWGPLAYAWIVAAGGITLRTVLAESLPLLAGTSIFLVMGWSGIFTFGILWKRFGFTFVQGLLGGGIAYSLGAVVLLLHEPTVIPGVIGPHEIWHIGVLTGLALHWRFVADCMQFAEVGGKADVNRLV